MIRPPQRSLVLLVLLAGLISSALAPTDARARTSSPPRGGTSSCAVGAPAPAVCDRTLGLALTIPAGWSVVSPGKFPPGTLAFWTLSPGNQEPSLHLVIAPLGTATTCTNAQAATAAANALVTASHSPRPVMRLSTTLGAAPAVLLAGLPGTPGVGVAFTVAHNGLVYGITAFGSGGRLGGYPTLTPAQRHALASLRFIPRSGPFPSRPDPFITPALRACATVHTEQLALEDVLMVSPLTFYVDGLGFAPRRTVIVRLTWRGTPLTGIKPRYTAYTAYRIIPPDRQGVFVTELSVPVSGAAFRSFTARIEAIGARGTCLATVRSVFTNSNGTIIPTQTTSTCGSASSDTPPIEGG